jgi:hypothetical protein
MKNQIIIPVHDVINGNYIFRITSINGSQGSQPFIITH